MLCVAYVLLIKCLLICDCLCVCPADAYLLLNIVAYRLVLLIVVCFRLLLLIACPCLSFVS